MDFRKVSPLMNVWNTASYLFHVLLSLGTGFDPQVATDHSWFSKERRAVIIAQERNVKKGTLEYGDRFILFGLVVESRRGIGLAIGIGRWVVVAVEPRVGWIRE